MATSRRTRSNPSPSPAPSVMSSDDASTFNPDNDDALMSTKHNIGEDDSRYFPKIRTTAQQYRFYNPEMPPNVPTSAVRREFGDFDHSNSTDGEDDSIEIARGGIGHTPSKPNKSLDSDILLEIGNSQYGTPQSRPRPTPKSNLRKEAQLRRASSNQVSNVATKTVKENLSPARVKSRIVSADGRQHQRIMTTIAGTPQRMNGTPRGVANSTAQSFLLPEMPNMTELFGGSVIENASTLPHRGLAGRRAVSHRAQSSQPNYIPIGGISIPEEEKHILASLQLLRDRLADMELEKADAEKRIEEYEVEVEGLKAQLDAQANLRRSDSALGASEGEGGVSSKAKWRLEKAQLEASIQSLNRRLDQADRKISVAESTAKRVTQERDSLAAQISVNYYNSEELKADHEDLQNENRILQDQVSDLQSENRALTAEIDELRAQADQSHERHEDETHRWTKREAALNRRASTHDRALLQENQTLRDEVVRAKEHQDEAERQFSKREAKARRETERAAQAEHERLMEEKDQLIAKLEEAKAARDAELKRWTSKQAELQAHIDQREQTIHQLQATVPQEQINDALRKENEDLKAELAGLKVRADAPQEQGTPKEVLRKRLEEVTNMHTEATERWTVKETRLQDRLHQAKEANKLYRQIDSVRLDGPIKNKRHSTGQNVKHVQAPSKEDLARDTMQTANRTRSTSQSRRAGHSGPSKNYRHASAPVPSAENDVAEPSEDSATSLSFDPAILAGAPRSGGNGKRATGFVRPAHTGDTTYLSYIDGDEIANLRKRLEEEHLAARQRKAAIEAAASGTEELTGYGVRRRVSQRDNTARSRASSRARSISRARSARSDIEADIEAGDTVEQKHDTVHSRLSQAARHRRRSSAAFTEMTSAFIIPDITIHTNNVAAGQDTLKAASSTHDTNNCSVCQRILSTSPVELSDLDIPTPIPVTQRKAYKNDVDATLRPSQPPSQALSQIIKELQDELHHLKLHFAVLSHKLKNTDPAMGKRAQDKLHATIDRLNKQIKVKQGQLYSLYDVLEAHSVELEAAEEDVELPEEVERTLDDILRARAGKKVGFGAKASTVESEDESEVGWGGISDTEGF